MKTKLHTLLAFALSASMMAACHQTPEPAGEPLFTVVPQNGTHTFEMGPEQTSLTDVTGLKVFVYSNQDWKITPSFDDPDGDNSWFSIYPTEGKDDGRFYINVTELTTPYPRRCKILFTNGKGEELLTADFVQNGTEAFITPDMTLLSYGSEGGELTLNIRSNVIWAAEVQPETAGTDVSWCRLGASGATSQTVVTTANTGDDKRAAIIHFYMVGREEVFADVTVTQLPEFKISNATLITIREALQHSGIIEDNLKFQGYVINDSETGNMDDESDLFLQDDSGRGIAVRLPDATRYPAGTKLSVWMTGGILKDSDDGIVRLYNMAAGNFSTETTLTGTEATPVDISDLSKMDDYPCTLVRLKGVYFTSPIGTLVNVGSWKSKACSYGLTRIVDNAGHIANIRTLGSFTQKFNKGLTANEYDITGIVLPDKGEWLHIDGDKSNLKQMDGYVFSHSLRIRSVDDLKDKGTAGHKVPIVYWLGINTTNSSYWVPAYGEGEFNLIKGITGATGPNNSARVSYILKDIPGAAEDANCYQGYSTVTYFDATYGGYFYELSTSTKTRSGQILFSFTVGVWGSAGRYMKLQSSTDGASWTDVPGADIELWNSYSSGTAAASDYTRLYSNQSFAFIIPDGAGKDRLYVRLTTQGKQNKRSDGSSSAVSNASSFALYYFAFSELK